MGYGRIDETMLYVHVASTDHRPLPPELCSGPTDDPDPDRRILYLLGQRALVKWDRSAKGANGGMTDFRGTHVAPERLATASETQEAVNC